TIYDEVDFVDSGFRAVAAGLDPTGSAPLVAFLRERFASCGSGRVFDDTIARFGLTQPITALVELYRSHSPDIALPSARAEVLAELHGRARFSLVSDGPYRTQRNKFDRLGLAAIVERPVFTDRLGAPKPAPAAFEAVMRDFADEREFVYVADNPRKDFIAPRALGWRTIRFRNPRGIYREHEGAADVEIDAFERLPAVL
ncbi:MAG: HAD family hydrolase, partial [Deltaproteobacteria bacterium]|nr:HAD family hydrolase [Nannocystaceae bacterium]